MGIPKKQRVLGVTFVVTGALLTGLFVVDNQERLASFVPREVIQRTKEYNSNSSIPQIKASVAINGTNKSSNHSSLVFQHHEDVVLTNTTTAPEVPTNFSTTNDDRATNKLKEYEDLWNNRTLIPRDVSGNRAHPKEQNCLALEDVCLSGRHWFYKHSNSSTQQQQPRVVVNLDSISNGNKPKYDLSYPTRLVVDHSAGHTSHQYCQESPIRNHLIMAAAFNNMLGEFYTRAIVSLIKGLQMWYPSSKSNNDQKAIQFLLQTQMYLHMTVKGKKLLDSHHLFTRPLRPNGTPLTDLRNLLDDQTAHGCTCLKRVIFCGYEIKEETTTTNNEKDTTTMMLTSGGETIPWLFHKFRETMYNDARTFLRRHTLDNNPFLQREIQLYRQSIWDDWKKVLRENSTHSSTTTTTMTEANVAIIGLVQRSLRRKWRNLNVKQPIAQMLAEKHGILLVEINVEDDSWNPHNQLVRHGALDGLIGIHGAQLTEAIWMKPGSLVVELLPFVPRTVRWGSWTRDVARATPGCELCKHVLAACWLSRDGGGDTALQSQCERCGVLAKK